MYCTNLRVFHVARLECEVQGGPAMGILDIGIGTKSREVSIIPFDKWLKVIYVAVESQFLEDCITWHCVAVLA